MHIYIYISLSIYIYVNERVARAHGLSQDYLYWDGWVGGVCGCVDVSMCVCIYVWVRGERQGPSRCVRRAQRAMSGILERPRVTRIQERPGAPRSAQESPKELYPLLRLTQNHKGKNWVYFVWNLEGLRSAAREGAREHPGGPWSPERPRAPRSA